MTDDKNKNKSESKASPQVTPPQVAQGAQGAAVSDKDIEAMLRVDHAGEYGAVRIYEAQLKILRQTLDGPALQEMLAHEEEHLAFFEKVMRERGIRPSAFLPLWDVCARGMGVVTALMGAPTAMAATVAVEEVIDKHYQEQEKKLALRQDEKDLLEKVRQFRAEEQEHHDEALRREAEKAPFYPIISEVIKAASRLAIKISTRY